MKILGLQKVTLIDYPEKIACTIFLFGCNFRCGFCHNPGLVNFSKSFKEYSQEEVFEFLGSRKDYLDGVCITGGEPLLSLEEDFLKKVKDLGYLIKLDTNGSFPEKLKDFIKKGFVDFVSMDIKNSPEKYKESVRVPVSLEKIEESIRIISKLSDYEFRTTIVEGIHDFEKIEKIAQWLNKIIGEKPKRFVLQGFKKEDKLLDDKFKKVNDTNEKTLNKMKEAIKEYFKEVDVRI